MNGNLVLSNHNFSPIDVVRSRMTDFGADLTDERLSILLEFQKSNIVLLNNISLGTKEKFYRSLNNNMIFDENEIQFKLNSAIETNERDLLNKNIIREFNVFMKKIDEEYKPYKDDKGKTIYPYTSDDKHRCLHLFLKYNIIPSKNTCYPHIIVGKQPVLTVQDNYLWMRDLFAKQIHACGLNVDIYTKNEWESFKDRKNLYKGKSFNLQDPEEIILPEIKGKSLDISASNISRFIVYPVFHDDRDACKYTAFYTMKEISDRIGNNAKGFVWTGGVHNVGQMLQKHAIRMYVKSFASSNAIVAAVDIMQAEASKIMD